MKISVSLPAADIAVLDNFVRTAGLPSRSAALRRAVQMLRLPDLERDYEAAWQEWESSGDDLAWSSTVDDGVTGAAW